jgi:hypothetical protein
MMPIISSCSNISESQLFNLTTDSAHTRTQEVILWLKPTCNTDMQVMQLSLPLGIGHTEYSEVL